MTQPSTHDLTSRPESTASPSAPSWRTPTIAAGLCLLITGAILGVADWQQTDISTLLRDPAAEFDVPVFAGSVSFIGITFLMLTAGACGLASRISPIARATLAGAGAMSLILAIDDQYMLHERVLDDWVGIPEIVTLSAYAICGLALLISIWTGPLKRWRGGLFVSLALMGASVLADLGDVSFVIEDVLKVSAFAAWSAFWVGVSWHACSGAESGATGT